LAENAIAEKHGRKMLPPNELCRKSNSELNANLAGNGTAHLNELQRACQTTPASEVRNVQID
jgi:hypothetical protein